MATATRSRKAAPKAIVEDVEEVEVQETEASPKQIINEGIDRFIQESGAEPSKARYKAMRAIAYQAFLEALEGDDFDGLVDRAVAGIDTLPSGWTLDPAEKAVAVVAEKPAAKKPAAKKTAKKAAAAEPVEEPEVKKPAARKRAVRKTV